MDWLWFSIAAFTTGSVLLGANFTIRAIRRHQAYDDLQPFDYCALEADLTNHVHDLNKVTR